MQTFSWGTIADTPFILELANCRMPNRINALLLALVIALVVAVMAMAIHVPPPITDAQVAAQNAAAQKHVCQYSLLVCAWKWTTHDPVAFYTSALALFTLVLAGSTIGLWYVTWKAAERAERSVRTVEGAWIFASPVLADIEAKKPKVRVLVKNHGKTPGRIVAYHMEFRDAAPQGDEPKYIEPVDETKTVWTCGPLDNPWPLPYEFDWNQNNSFAVGFIEYETAFSKKTRKSRFCYDVSDATIIRPAGSPAYNSFRPEED